MVTSLHHSQGNSFPDRQRHHAIDCPTKQALLSRSLIHSPNSHRSQASTAPDTEKIPLSSLDVLKINKAIIYSIFDAPTVESSEGYRLQQKIWKSLYQITRKGVQTEFKELNDHLKRWEHFYGK